nr:hypothetical protein [Paraeggerthella hongkongensis]
MSVEIGNKNTSLRSGQAGCLGELTGTVGGIGQVIERTEDKRRIERAIGKVGEVAGIKTHDALKEACIWVGFRGFDVAPGHVACDDAVTKPREVEVVGAHPRAAVEYAAVRFQDFPQVDARRPPLELMAPVPRPAAPLVENG